MQDRRIQGAIDYAKADRSDPFALRRAMSHIRSGVATYCNSQGKEAFYSAESYQETRMLPDGREYQATVYKNMVRP